MENSSLVQKVLIVEDDSQLANFMKNMIEATSGFEFSGIADSYTGCINLLEQDVPDIMIVDIDLNEDRNGIDIIRYAASEYPTVEIIVHTIYDSGDMLFRALEEGASGYVLKGLSPVDFISCLQEIKKGSVPMSPKIARMVLARFRGKSKEADAEEALSARETEILQLAGKGYTYKQIAEAYNISWHTVHSHLKQIYSKLRVSSKREAIQKARRMAII